MSRRDRIPPPPRGPVRKISVCSPRFYRQIASLHGLLSAMLPLAEGHVVLYAE